MAVAVLAALKRRGLFDGRVLTTCWIAGATLEAVYALGRVSTNGMAAHIGADSSLCLTLALTLTLTLALALWLCRAFIHESLGPSVMDRHDG